MTLFKLFIIMTLFNTAIQAQTLEPKSSIYDISIDDINGKPINLADYKGKKVPNAVSQVNIKAYRNYIQFIKIN